MWPEADSSLTVPCRTPRPQVGEHPRTYQLRVTGAIMACEARRKGWQDRDAELKALFTGEGNAQDD